MLRHVLLISRSGLVLFTKRLHPLVDQPGLVGSLLRTLVEVSRSAVGLPVSYLQFASSVSVSIVLDAFTGVMCALFYDTNDGKHFGQRVARDTLASFITLFSTRVTTVGHNLSDYLHFQYQLVDVVRQSITPLLYEVQRAGVRAAVVVTVKRLVFSSTDVDELSILANLRALGRAAVQTMSSVGDKAVHTYIQCGDGSRILVWNLAGAALILYCPEHMKPEEFPPGVERAIGAISTACFWIASMGR